MGMRKRVAAAIAVVGLVGMGTCVARTSQDADTMGATVANDAGRFANQLPATAGGSAAMVQPMSAGATATATGGSEGFDDASASAARKVTDTSGDEDLAGAPLPQGLGAPQVIKTAVIEIQVPEGRFGAAFTKVPAIVAGLGGFVSSSTSSQAEAGDASDDDGPRQAAGSVVVRVPAEQFEAARTQLIGLGKLRTQQVSGDDVSAQLTDLDARLRNLRSQEEAIRLLMTKTTNVGETIEVQRQLGNVREQIERLAAEQARLGDAVAMSTLTLHLAEPGAVVENPGDPSPLGDALGRALDGAQAVLAGVIVTLGYLLPLAVLLALGWLAARPFLARRTGAGAAAVSSS